MGESVSGSDPAERTFQFHLEEFRQLKAEILLQQRIQFSIEAGAATAVFTIIGYLVAHEAEVVSRGGLWAWWLPVGVVVVAVALSRAFVSRAYQIGDYIKETEQAYASNQKGWEHHLHPPGGKRQQRISPAKRRFWLFLLALSVAVAVTMTHAPVTALLREALVLLGWVR